MLGANLAIPDQSVASYHVDEEKFTAGPPDAGNNNTPPAWKAKG